MYAFIYAIYYAFFLFLCCYCAFCFVQSDSCTFNKTSKLPQFTTLMRKTLPYVKIEICFEIPMRFFNTFVIKADFHSTLGDFEHRFNVIVFFLEFSLANLVFSIFVNQNCIKLLTLCVETNLTLFVFFSLNVIHRSKMSPRKCILTLT